MINRGKWMSQHGMWLPRRVQAGVISETFGDGTAVVVQLDSHQAHSLDAVAARVWKLADGTRSVSAVALAAGVPTERVAATLAQLDGLGLLEEDTVGGHSRRSVLARAAQLGGGLVVAGGVINSMALPAAAAAVSAVDSFLSIYYMYNSTGPGTGQGAYFYQTPNSGPGENPFADLPSPSIWLTDTGAVPGQPSSAPYVTITPGSTGGPEGSVTLTFDQVPGATASYGPGGESAAGISLGSSPVTVNIATQTEVTVTIGT